MIAGDYRAGGAASVPGPRRPPLRKSTRLLFAALLQLTHETRSALFPVALPPGFTRHSMLRLVWRGRPGRDLPFDGPRDFAGTRQSGARGQQPWNGRWISLEPYWGLSRGRALEQRAERLRHAGWVEQCGEWHQRVRPGRRLV